MVKSIQLQRKLVLEIIWIHHCGSIWSYISIFLSYSLHRVAHQEPASPVKESGQNMGYERKFGPVTVRPRGPIM